MKTVVIEPQFAAWRSAARRLIADQVKPADVFWSSGRKDAGGLLPFDQVRVDSKHRPRLTVPKLFVRLAETVSCHRSGKQWAMLYEILWEMTHGNDRDVLRNQTHATVRGLEQMRKAVSRDIHKMRAFVRFRKIQAGDEGNSSYVSWYEPEHLIMRLNATFFCKRFAGMIWSILTPDECIHWNGEKVSYTGGVDRSQAPDADSLEELWLRYYRSTFNPARLKIQMMQSEMPKKYWKNLPEASIIEELIQGSNEAVQNMMLAKEIAPKPTGKKSRRKK